MTPKINPNPWIYFFVPLAANAVLSYFPFSYPTKGWVFLLGILIPGLLYANVSKPVRSLEAEFLPYSPKAWVLWLLLVFALFLRFYKLTVFHLWPTGDESLHGFLAIPLSEQWSWRFFYTVGEHPPLLIWALSFFFRFFESPFFNLWFLPAFFSALAVPLGYLSARGLFSKSLSIIVGLLWAFSFWPLYFGRFCHQGIFIPFWELITFFLLGRYWKNFRHEPGKGNLLILGLWIGLGFLTFISWASVALFSTMVVWAVCFRKRPQKLYTFIFFMLGLLGGLLPFLSAVSREGYGHHLIDSSTASHWFSGSHQILTSLCYFTCLFWGSFQADTSYGPVWGGILNPVLSSCFFLGTIEVFKNRSNPLAKWLGLGLLLSLLPALLATDYVEFNRIIQTIPFLLVFAGVGIQKLIQTFKNNQKKVLILFALLAVSAGLDINHLLKTSMLNRPWGTEPKKDFYNEGFEAYKILDAVYQTRGPGLVFTDFLPLSHNHSLDVATYHFNGALNPRLGAPNAQWTAILTNNGYEPFLAKRFPKGHWYWAGKDLSSLEGGLMVGIISLDESNRPVFERWKQAHQYFHQLNIEAENSFNNLKDYQTTLRHLLAGYDLMKGDPFLESSYAEWCAQYFYSPSYSENVDILQTALRRGYPASHLYKKLSDVLAIQGKTVESKKALEKAYSLKLTFRLGPSLEFETNEKKP